MTRKQKPSLPYSVGDLLTDVEREFKFLVDEYGFVPSSKHFTAHSDYAKTITAEHVSATAPVVKCRVTKEWPEHRRLLDSERD